MKRILLLFALLVVSVFGWTAFAQEVSGGKNCETVKEKPNYITPAPSKILAIDTILDGSFEFGGYWNDYSSNFGFTNCDVGWCGTGLGSGPRTGFYWSWHGGIAAVEIGEVSQFVQLEESDSLVFYLEAPLCSGSSSDEFWVMVDSDTIMAVSASSYGFCDQVGYRRISLPIMQYSDGGVHQIKFRSESLSGSITNWFVDDVEIIKDIFKVEAISVTNPRCVGSNDGIILLEGSGGSQPYQFSLDSINFKYGSSFSGLAPGDYVVWMKDINGQVTKSDTITVGSAKALVGGLVAKTNPKCINQMNGTLRLEASGGKAPYTFTLPSQGKTNNTGVFKNLGPGVYVPEIRDALGCLLVLDSVFLTAPTEVLFSVFVNQIPNCSQGNTGSIHVVVDQGTGPFNYYLNGELQASAQFDDLGIGTYQIRVEDANGCLSASQEVSLTGPSLIGIANVQTTPAECPFGLGVIQITPSGDTAGVQYSIDGVNFSTSPIFDSLLTGNYTVYVSNLAGCTASQEVLVEQAAGLDVAYTLSQGEDCSNQAPASITFTASNGVPPYAYRMNLNPFQSSPTFDSLPAGTHSFTIIDSRGCALGVGPIEVNPYKTMELAAFVDVSPSCASSVDGSIVGVVNFGVAPYTYALTGFNDQNTGVFTGVAAGAYYFEVRDARGCSIGDSLFVSAPSPLSVSLGTVQDLSCFSEGNGIIQAMASGGTAPYTYSLDGQNFVSQPVFGALTRGSYRVTVQDANGCKALSNFVTLSTPSAANVQITVNHVKCYGGNDGRVVLTINGGEGPFTYGESIDGPWFPISNLNNLEAGAFQLYVRDNKGCVTYAGAVEITQPSELALNYTVMPEVSPRSGKIFLNASGGTKPYAYYYFRNGWQGIVGTEISFLAGGDYWLVVQDNRGCTDTAVVNVPSQLSLAEADGAEVTLYPNPSQGRVVLSWDNVKPVRVWVSNAMGQQVFEYSLAGAAESGSVEINHEAWSAGWYVLYWEDDTGLIHPMKWMVQE